MHCGIWPREPRKKIRSQRCSAATQWLHARGGEGGCRRWYVRTEYEVVNLLFHRVATWHMHTHTTASCVAVAEAVADGGFCIAKASRA